MNVAVLVATYGDKRWIERAERALASAREQNATARHLHAYHGLTLADARNALARTSTADWLCFLDADDELEPGYLDAMERANGGWIYPQLENGWETGPPPLLVPLLRRVHNGDLSNAWASWPNKGQWPKVNEAVIGTLVHRRLFEQVGGFRDTTDDGTPITMYEDWDLWLRCYDAGAKLVYTDAVYREHVNPAGRNTNTHEAQTVYDAIWNDHLQRDTVVAE